MKIASYKTFCLGALVALAAPATAAVISINFDNGGNSVTGTTGAVSAGNWNNVGFGASSSANTVLNLQDDNGTTTTVDIALRNESANTAGGFDAALSGASGQALNLFTERNRNGGAVATFSEIPTTFTTSGYDVYVYFGLVDSTFKLDDGTTITEFAADANGDGSSFVEATGGLTFNDEGAGNYFVFRNQSASSFTLTTGDAIADGQGENNGFVYGMQIVQIPEPSASMLLGIAGLALAVRRRR